MRKSIFLFATILFIVSCQKDNITVNLKMSGTLSAKVIDNNNNPLANENVKLYSYYSGSSSSDYLDKIKTNSNGDVNFGELNEGTYYLVVDTPKVNGIKYLPVKATQVVSGSGKNVTINVQEYSGTLNVKLIDYNYNALSGYNIILIAYEDINNSDDINTLISKAEFHSTTNNSGLAVFQIPSSREFYILAYDSTKTYTESYGYVYVDKDETRNVTIEMYIY